MKKLKYAIIGTGALGGYYGGKLANAQKEVHFMFHSDYEWVKENGLKVESVNGDFHLPSVNAYKATKGMPVCDVVLVCMKTTSEPLLKSLLEPLMHSTTSVILIQNGFGNEERLILDFPSAQVGGGLGFICANKVGPGHVAHLDYGRLTLGSYTIADQEILAAVCADFKEAGVPADVSDDLRLSRWKKLVWNVPFNGLCVVMNATTEDLLLNPSTYILVRDLMQEVIGAANADGSKIEDGFIEGMLDYSLKMKPYAPSMKLDYDFKRPMEIEAIYRRTLAEAASIGFEMPKVAMLKAQLEYMEAQLIK